MANPSPTLTNLASSVTYLENTANSAALLLDPNVAFSHTTNNFNGGRLTVTGISSSDVISVRHQGNAAGQIGFLGGIVKFGGVEIGTLTRSDGVAFIITFNGAATATAIDALIQNLTYTNPSDAPAASRTFKINVQDAGGFATLSSPTFSEQQSSLPGAAFLIASVGADSAPTFVDLDGDGDLDGVVGEADGVLNYFRNNGPSSLFEPLLGAANPFDEVDIGSNSTPSFADLDNDGDFDLVVGESSGILNYFRNVGTATTPNFLQQTGANNPFDGIDVGSFSTPTLIRLDGDLDFDLVVGANDGTITYYRNTGTVSAPVFTPQTGGNNPFNGVDFGTRSTPQLVDLDGDGDLDAVIGEATGAPRRYFLNTGSTSTPVFTEQVSPNNPFEPNNPVSLNAAPSFVDLDRDGDLDEVLGRSNGDVVYFRNESAGMPITVNLILQDDAPELSGFIPPVTFFENDIQAVPQRIDVAVSFVHPEGNMSGGSLTVTGLLPEDRVSIRNQGTTGSQVGFDGTNVTVGGTAIGTATGGVGGTFTLTFNGASPNQVEVRLVIQNLTFTTSSNVPTADRTLTLTVRDAAGNATVSTQGFTELTGAANPVAGIDVGFRSAPVLIDLDGDFVLDLVVGEAFGTIAYFRNTGNALAPVFTPQTGAANPFNGIDIGSLAAPTFADLDGDGDRDLIVGRTDGLLNYFRRDGSAAVPVFTPQTGAANPFNGIDAGAFAKPALADIDGDGDLDMLVGISALGFHSFFRNTGSAASPVFTPQTGAANPFNGVSFGNKMAPVFRDFDGDGDRDLLSGSDNDTSSLHYHRNVGSPTEPVFVTHFFNADDPFAGILMLEEAIPTIGDLDGDGDADVVVGDFDGTLHYLQNRPAIRFTLQISDASPFEGLDVGSRSAPAFADLDGDGDRDMIVGTSTGVLSYFRNNGTASAPVYLPQSGTNPFAGLDVGDDARPAFADLDSDGDLDLVLGADDGLLRYYRNNRPDTTNFVTQTGAANPFNGVDVGSDSAAAFGDLDGDGDLDALVGESTGTLRYFRNVTENPTVPDFSEQTGVNNPFNGLDLGSPTTPTLGDFDQDGDLDAIIGLGNLVLETLAFFKNIGTAAAPVFVRQWGGANPFGNVFPSGSAAPVFVDLDSDRDLDLVSGVNSGGLAYFRSDAVGIELSINITAEPELRNDFNGDVHSDILLHNITTGNAYAWQMDGTNLVGSGPIGWSPGGVWQTRTTGDYNGDGHADILLQNTTSGDCFVWEVDGTSLVGSGAVAWTPGAIWQAKDSGDFNRDGNSDILLQNVNDGSCYIWELNGTSLVGSGAVGWTPGAEWQAKATGDFNGDGYSDILLQNVNDGACYIWELNGTSLVGSGAVGWVPGGVWQARTTGDYNGDGKSDILLQNADTGSCFVWLMDGTNLIGSGPVGWEPGAEWRATSGGDYNSDGKSDILLQNVNSGAAYMWLVDGTTLIGNSPVGWAPGGEWHII